MSTIGYYQKASRPIWNRIKRAFILMTLLIFAGMAVTMVRFPYVFVRTYYRIRVTQAGTIEQKVQIAREWAMWNSVRGTPKLVFDLFPGAKPKDDGRILCFKTSWDDPQYVWANNSEAGVASWDVQRFADKIGMMPITTAELNDDFKRWSTNRLTPATTMPAIREINGDAASK